jgi:hypothetical protein
MTESHPLTLTLSPANKGEGRMHRNRHLQSRLRKITAFAIAAVVSVMLLCGPLVAQNVAPAKQAPRERFVPADQLGTVFSLDGEGVLLPRVEFEELLRLAETNASENDDHPAAIVIERAALTITPGEHQAQVSATLTIRQFTDGWQVLRIPGGNLNIEKAELDDGSAATIGRDAKNPSILLVAGNTAGTTTLTLTMSSTLATVGNDRSAAFQLPGIASTTLSVTCPANQQLLLNDLKLNRPAADDQPADYTVPVGAADQVRLRWTDLQTESESQTLVFVRTDGQIQVQTESLRWTSDSRVSVFGGSINQVIARVPSHLEVTAVESSGLEGWVLEDDVESKGSTRVVLTFRQPFSKDRVIQISGVATVSQDKWQVIPTLEFINVTSHAGRLLVTHADGLRLTADAVSGVRQISPSQVKADVRGASVFDFWQQQFDLKVAVKPRDQELFTELSSSLVFSDTTAVFSTTVTTETLNAPLFELPLTLPADWHLSNVTSNGTPIDWRTTGDPNRIVVVPPAAVPVNGMLQVTLQLQRTIPDPETEQRLPMPFVVPIDTTIVGGQYSVTFAADLSVSPVTVTGLVPVAGSGTQLLFRMQGSTFAGELTILRKVPQLISRSELRTWADLRQQTLTADITVDVVNGTTREITIELPEELGTDVRFRVVGTGRVPGVELQLFTGTASIAEQTPLEPTDGMRPFVLKLQNRFAGSLSFQAIVQRPIEADRPLAAPVVRVRDAVRQHGVLVFEAYPEQKMTPSQSVSDIDGVFEADPSVVETPNINTGRRIALTYRFVKPDFSFTVAREQFGTETVPSAVCQHMSTQFLLNESGDVQQGCKASFQMSGVQTLRFTLPTADKDRAFLWSTMLNGEPVEVRRDDGDYLVAVPQQSDNADLEVELLFESAAVQPDTLGRLEQHPVVFSIDVGDTAGMAIDVLQQEWIVRYPQSTALVESDGPFRAVDGTDQPGWFRQLLSGEPPSLDQMGGRLMLPLFIGGVMFVITVLIRRRRWKTMAAIAVILPILTMLTLPLSMNSTATHQYLVDTTAEPSAIMSDGSVLFHRHPGDAAGESAGLNTEFSVDVAMDDMTAEEWENRNSDTSPPVGTNNFSTSEAENSDRGESHNRGMGLPGSPEPPGDMGGGGFRGGAGGGLGGGGFGGGGGGGRRAGGDLIVLDSLLPATSAETSQNDPSQVADNEQAPAERPMAVSGARIAGQAGSASSGRQRRGKARLSVRVNLEAPSDFRTRKFLSLGDSIATPGVLNIVVQEQERITALRMIAALVVILLCWLMRSSRLVSRLTFLAVLLAVAAAAIPLASNRWQSLLDGIVIGCVAGLSLWAVSLAVQTVKRMGGLLVCLKGWAFARIGASTAALLIATVLTHSAAIGQQPEPKDLRPDVVIPYSPDAPAMQASQVFVDRDKFLKLYRLAYPDALPTGDRNPLGTAVVAAFYQASDFASVNNKQSVLHVKARYVITCDTALGAAIPLPIGSVALSSAKLDGQEALLKPTEVPPPPIPQPQAQQQAVQNIQQQQKRKVAPAPQHAYTIQVRGKGAHILDVEFDITAAITGDLGRIDIPLLPVASGTFDLTVPIENADVRVNGRTVGFRRTGSLITVPIASAGATRIQWQPDTRRDAADSVFHSVVSTALAVTDSGVQFRSAVAINVRQGEISEVDVVIPADYAIQTVIGPDIAGWEVVATDQSRALRLQFRRAITDSTSVTMTLFVDQQIQADRVLLQMPVLEIRGATRDTGTVTLLTGEQFQVRSDALSGVTQINPQDAPVPAGDALPGRRMLAWRYTRHPASAAVRISRTAEEVIVTDVHAMQLEDQRQLWTSHFTVRISGAARSRIDIKVPAEFLVLEASADGLSDWYVDDSENPAATTRIVSIQLQSAREGKVDITLHGQLERAADRSRLTLLPPEIVGATRRSGQMAVWLDSASENAGVESGDWTIRPVGTLDARYRNLTSRKVDVAFQTTKLSAGAAVISLRKAVPTVLAESVIVTTATDTSIESTLALNWQITRAASDSFIVEIPTTLARALTFDVPNHRRTLREELADGRTRITFQLQQPVSDRLFVLGAGSLPLPNDGLLKPQPPLFVTDQDSTITLAGQSHFWVIVNQSGGLFEPTADPEKDAVTTGQLSTAIPQAFLDQQVSIQRLTADTTAWRLAFPVQQQVTPAVVTLATHTTVLSDDGSWRSQHVLQVRNESRQFLPVQFPEGARLMYCLVSGRPTRVVRNSGDASAWYLIPIPQSGLTAAAFEVKFALAGNMGGNVGDIRRQWQAQRLQIPIPTFPEFRDDADLGISVSRNRWSVYVPQSWRTELVEDPRLTNVTAAQQAVLEDVSLRSVLEQTSSLMSSAQSTKLGFIKGKMVEQLELQREMISNTTGNDAAVETERRESLSKLEALTQKYKSEIVVEQQAGGGIQLQESLAPGNFFLNQADQGQNSFNAFNNSDFLNSNRAGGSQQSGQTGGEPQTNVDAAVRFRFALPQKPAIELGKELEEARDKDTTNSKSEKKGQGVNKSVDEKLRAPSRKSRLLRRQSQAADQPNAPAAVDELAAFGRDPAGGVIRGGEGLAPHTVRGQVDLQQMQDLGILILQGNQTDANQVQQLFEQQAGRQGNAASDKAPASPMTPPVPTGTLSLVFEIPTDGYRLDFVRTGGNASLSLDARASQAVSKGMGLIWALLCGIGVIVLMKAARTSGLAFLHRLSLLLTAASLAGWIVLPSPVNNLCMVIGVIAAGCFCITFLVNSFRKPVAA